MYRLLLGVLLTACALAQSAEESNFMAGLPDGRQLSDMLPGHLKRKGARLLEERRKRIASFATAGDFQQRQRYLRERMTHGLGGLPERTPLEARTVGILEREDFRIEKVIFESQPKFYVTANLYLPKRGRPPYPAILFPLGHEPGAKAYPIWQQMLCSLAKKGYVALTWDPVGQGERVQLFDEDLRESKAVRSTSEHTMLGIQCLLVGDNLARYTTWDGMRALDYLLSRKEVDPNRIGCTGNSGGGTHTAYLAALDDRIHVAAPSCYLTSWSRLLETIGPQDAEQCIPPWLADGLDHADFIHAFAPKPYLILSAIRDFFSITGARETFQEARRNYQLAGAADKIDMVEADDGHGYSKPRRMAAYRWFSRWLKGVEDQEAEPEVPIAAEEELNCTATGQVATTLGGETVFTLNLKRFEQLRSSRSLAEARRLTGFSPPPGVPRVHSFGRLERPGMRIEKFLYESEPGIVVPSLLYVPNSPAGRKPAVILVHGRGKAAARDEAFELANSGLAVLSVDVRGFGETAAPIARPSDWSSFFGHYESVMNALLTGKPLVAMRAEDIARAVELLAAHPDVDAQRIYALGREAGAVPTLYGAAFDGRIARVALEGMLLSYQTVVTQRFHRQVFEHVVPGALRAYDLPDLAAWMAPRPVWIVDPVDAVGKPAAIEEARRQYGRAPSARVLRRRPEDTVTSLYAGLLK